MLNHRRAARPASPETIFSIDYQSIPCSTKKPGAKISFQLGEQFTQTRRPTMQNGEIRPKISEKYFLENSMKILKIENFDFSRKRTTFSIFKFLLIFREKIFEFFRKKVEKKISMSPTSKSIFSMIKNYVLLSFFATTPFLLVVAQKHSLISIFPYP